MTSTVMPETEGYPASCCKAEKIADNAFRVSAMTSTVMPETEGCPASCLTKEDRGLALGLCDDADTFALETVAAAALRPVNDHDVTHARDAGTERAVRSFDGGDWAAPGLPEHV